MVSPAQAERWSQVWSIVMDWREVTTIRTKHIVVRPVCAKQVVAVFGVMQARNSDLCAQLRGMYTLVSQTQKQV